MFRVGKLTAAHCAALGMINQENQRLKPRVEETIERMKIAITYLQEYLEGKRDTVYYWELENEEYK